MKHFLAITFALVFVMSSMFAQATKQDLNRLVANQDYEAAGKIVEEVIKANKEDATTLISCANIYEELDNYHRASEIYKMADKAKSGKYQTYLLIGAACAKDSNYDEASKWFNKAIKKISKKKKKALIDAKLKYADGLILADSLDKAEKIIIAIKSKERENPEVFLKLGNLYFAQRIFALAETNYKTVLEFEPENIPARISLAVSYYWLGNQESANADLRNEYYSRCLAEWGIVSEKDPKNAKAWFMQGKILYFAKKYKESAKAFEEYILLRPSDIEARWMLGKSYFQVAMCDKARVNLEMVAEKNDSLKDEANLFLAQCFLESEQYPECIEKYNQIQTPLAMADRRRLGRAYLASGDSLDAYKTWREAYDEDPNDPNNVNFIRLSVLQMGTMKPKMRTEAVELGELWLSNPKAPEKFKQSMLYVVGQHYLFLDSMEKDTTGHIKSFKAIEFLNKSIAIDSQHVYSYMYLGDAYAKIDSIDKALATFNKSIEIAKQDTAKYKRTMISLYSKAGGIYYKNKQWDELIKLSTDWTAMQPKVEYAWMFLGLAYHSKEDIAQAKKAYKKCLEINPKNKTAKQSLKQIKVAGQ